ncbi:helix-turn-helix domain-containing protein [Streptomyces anthocyanicus]|uniref:helix-turn-helix domain-containing protein n=1 Tax=Streptomyces anthocyanicus TaxID=68174 RepID=UPI002244A5A5|nr:helix-turn-helix domain-containing protein [Streptomyces anthocyanicus]MCW8121851.1 helix-turn-helix domain-containing protein [Streptomyces anthocyanicus]
MDGLFDLDIIPEPGPRSGGLPVPEQRRRLRRQSRLSLHQIADACGVSEDTVRAWEQGSTTPRGDTAAIYRHLLAALQARQEGTAGPQPSPAQAPDWAALGVLRHEIPTQAAVHAPCRRCQQPTPHRVGGHPQHLGTRCPTLDVDRALPASPAPGPGPSRFEAGGPALPVQRPPLEAGPTMRLAYPPIKARGMSDGPLAVLEAGPPELIAHLADGRTRTCPAHDLHGLLAWAVRTPLGAAPVRREALPPGPLLVLTSTARARLALPAGLPDLPARHPRSDHPLLQQARAIGWQTDADGLGAWTRLHPSGGDPACDRIHLAVTDWGALHHDAWNLPEHLTPAELAAALGQYTALVRTPLGPPGACGHQLMRDLRPPAHRHTATGALLTGGVGGALTRPVDPAPCEAPPGHQLASHRADQDALADTDIDWWRPPAPDEADRPYAVCLAVNLFHLAGIREIQVADGPAHHVLRPPIDLKRPGSWLIDLSAVPQHPMLPPAFAGTGPAWHTTPAVAYAALRVGTAQLPPPAEGWLRPDPTGPYLAPWYDHLRLARLAVLERLGITATMDTPDLLAALAALAQADPLQRALLHALHATGQDGLAALAQPPAQPDQAALAAWPSPKDPTWRPDLYAAVVANARANIHRKLARTARSGYWPLAVAGGHIVYATRTPHLTEITDTPYSDFRIGISPGHVLPVAVRPLHWYTARCAEGTNPAQLLKDTCPSW